MKKYILTLIVTFVFALAGSGLMAQDPPPPPGNHGQTGTQPPGGGAPISSGVVILLTLSVAYGSKKVYNSWKKIGD